MEINRTDAALNAQYRNAQNTQKTQEEELEALAAEEKQATKPATQAAAPAPVSADAVTDHSAKQAVAQQAAGSDAAAVSSAASTSEDDDSDYQAIVTKANSGQQLTSAELETLRGRNPALYAKALQAQNARAELRTAMEEDPAAAYQTARSAMASVGRAASEGDETLAAVHRALADEYKDFATKYDHVELSGRLMQPFIEEG